MKVDQNDPAIGNPSKFIGQSFTKEKAQQYMDEYAWQMKEQEPEIWRRVVPSPAPLYIFNGRSIKHLVDFGTIVIAGGGGGIPAYNLEDGTLEGLNGVIDKDMTAALLGRIIKAQELFIITDVDNIYLNFKTESQEIIRETTAKDIKTWLNEGHFWRGSMEPKIKAALYFLKHHGKEVIITSIDNIKQAIQKQAGTRILGN
jgi:carbamate kinase